MRDDLEVIDVDGSADRFRSTPSSGPLGSQSDMTEDDELEQKWDEDL